MSRDRSAIQSTCLCGAEFLHTAPYEQNGDRLYYSICADVLVMKSESGTHFAHKAQNAF